jgi:hypothetical protein
LLRSCGSHVREAVDEIRRRAERRNNYCIVLRYLGEIVLLFAFVDVVSVFDIAAEAPCLTPKLPNQAKLQ